MSGPLGITVVAYACLVLAAFLAVLEAALPTFGAAGTAALILAVVGGAGVVRAEGPWWPLLAIAIAAVCWAVAVIGGRPHSAIERAGIGAFAGGSLLYGALADDLATVALGTGASVGAAMVVPMLGSRVAALRDAPSVTGQGALVGRPATVARWDETRGTIRLEGSLWNATGPSGLSAGDTVLVEAWSGLTAIVAAPAPAGGGAQRP
jgi:membrane protein implicated in regulation of membrane protease activity